MSRSDEIKSQLDNLAGITAQIDQAQANIEAISQMPGVPRKWVEESLARIDCDRRQVEIMRTYLRRL